MKQFFRLQLRTTNVPAARDFYTALLGEGAANADIVPLPEQAAARGAPAHWLGYVGVEDVDQAVRAFTERGAVQLGPTHPAPGGGRVAILRDPGGAIIGVATAPVPERAPQPEVAWQQLYAANAQQAATTYCDLFGWRLADRRDLGGLGVHQEFVCRPDAGSTGSVVDVAGLTGVHSHWLFHFRVAALAPALEVVRKAGGTVVGPMELPNGDRIAVCEDPQRAAFALREGNAR
ncbi:hypothetical protein NR800_05645 [Corallococcus interemptor]|uniref:VOC family protein n=1 Tax=Corallococcus TaxID=83461 RepID=UPI001CC019B0|nr:MULTISPECIES: VOC family protein [unclassified Corallococcus]MBZ4336310.1 hypothetical protein [Corallococcus sp. AS-1-12]MBZ4377263.1 hypothetical protein [Corallococcus sp. AS-1-6]